MTNPPVTARYWIPGPATAEFPNRCTWVPVVEAPAKTRRFVGTPAFEVTVKDYGMDKPVKATLLGLNRDNALVQYASGLVDEVYLSHVAEAGRFTRKIKKVLKWLSWLTRELGRTRASEAALAKRTAEREGREFTCPACEGAFIATKTKMVNHGFNRPGHGHLIGACFGVNLVCTEVSDSGIKLWLAHLVTCANNVKAGLASQKTRTTVTVGSRWAGEKPKTYTKGEAGFDVAVKAITDDLTSTLRHLERDIERTTARLAAWKPAKA